MKALLLIDIQNIYFTKGKYLLQEPERAALVAAELLEDFRSKGLPVIHVKHEFNTDGYMEDHEALNTIHESVKPMPGEKIVHKTKPNSFLNTDLNNYLEENHISELVIAGMMSHMCIDTTVRACQDFGYQVTVIEDACTTKSLFYEGTEIDARMVHQVYMAGLNGMFASVVTLKDYKKSN